MARKPSTIIKYVPQPVASKPESLGRKIGGFIGDAAQKLFKSITGIGDYTVKHNTLLNAADPPEFVSPVSGKRCVCVRHREFISDVSGSIAFTNQQTLNLNPGLSATFPWLNRIAEQFEEYAIVGLVFQFKSTSAASITSGTNTAMGTVMMATQYNVNSPAFTDKVHLENYEFSTSCKPYENALHPVECDPSQNVSRELYVRNDSLVTTGQDLRLYDMGLFQLSTVGFQSANIIGELWASYDIELYKPRIAVASSRSIDEHFVIPLSTAAAPFTISSTGVTVSSSSRIPYASGSIGWVSSTTLNLGSLPIGNYILRVLIDGGAAALVMPTIAVTGATTGPLIFRDNVAASASPGVVTTGTGTSMEYNLSFTNAAVIQAGNVLSIATNGTFPTGNTSMDVYVQGNSLTN